MTTSPPARAIPRADVLVALASAPLLLATWRVLGTPARFVTLFGTEAASGLDGLAPYLWTFGTFAGSCLVLPLLHAKARGLGPLGDLGWRVPRGGATWLLTLVLVAAAAGAGWHSGTLPAIRAEYPLFHALSSRRDLVLPYEAAYVLLYYVAWEAYFRGYLLFALERAFGGWEAVLVSATSACLVHIGKPEMELVGSFPFSVAMGWWALRTRSFWPCLLVHAALGVATDLSSLGA